MRTLKDFIKIHLATHTRGRYAASYSRSCSTNISTSCCSRVSKPSLLDTIRENIFKKERQQIEDQKRQAEENKVLQTEQQGLHEKIEGRPNESAQPREFIYRQNNNELENNEKQIELEKVDKVDLNLHESDKNGIKLFILANNDSAETSHNKEVKKQCSDKAFRSAAISYEKPIHVTGSRKSAEVSKNSSSLNVTKKESFKHKLNIKEVNRSLNGIIKSKINS